MGAVPGAGDGQTEADCYLTCRGSTRGERGPPGSIDFLQETHTQVTDRHLMVERRQAGLQLKKNPAYGRQNISPKTPTIGLKQIAKDTAFQWCILSVSFSYDAVVRTALATLGLLNTSVSSLLTFFSTI